jgi:hypothetical protein
MIEIGLNYLEFGKTFCFSLIACCFILMVRDIVVASIRGRLQ